MKTLLIKFIAAPLIALLNLAGYVPATTVQKPVIIHRTVPSRTPSPSATIKKSPSPSPSIKLGAFEPAGSGTYRLQSSISSTATSMTLTSFKEPISNIPYTMSYLGSDTVYGTFDSGFPTKTEFTSFTGITQNTDGTATLTGLSRGLVKTIGSGGCTASTTFATSHAGQSTFILSNSPCFYTQFAIKANNENVTGAWTTTEPTNSSGIATKNYVDTHVSGGTISTDKVNVAGTAGETVAAGQVLYLRQNDARWYKASVSIPEATSTILGIAQGAGTAGVAISGGVLVQGLDTNQSGLTAGVNYFVGPTAGTISTATSSRIVGRANTSSQLYVNTTFQDSGLFTVNGATTTMASNLLLASTSNLTVNGVSTLNSTTTIKSGIPFVTKISSLTNDGTTMTLSNVSSTGDYMKVLVMASTTNGSGTTGWNITFNGDSSSSYLTPASGGTTVTGTSINMWPFSGAGGQQFLTLDIHNPNGSNKFITINGSSYNGSTGGSAATSTSAIWRNNSQINTITVTAGTPTAMSTGYIKVYQNAQ